MNSIEPATIIIRARRQGVELFARADGRLGWKASPRPSDELLTVLAQHKAGILALLPPPHPASGASPAIGLAKAIVARLRLLRFRAYLDGHALGIADTTGRRRDVSRFIPANELFRTLVAGLDADPALLDSEERQ